MGWFDGIINNTFQGVSDIFSGNIGQGLSEIAPAAIAAGTAYMTGGASLGADAALYGSELDATGSLAAQAGSYLAPAELDATGSLVAQAGGLAPELDPTGSLAQMAAQSGGASLPSLGSILGYAKTAAPIIGGLGQITGGIGSLLAGQRAGQLAGQADPFGPYRSQYASQLSELMRNPQTVTSTPGYQFNLAQGLQGQQAQQAAQGRLVSGGALLQGQQFGQQLAGQTYQQQLATLASLSGAAQSPATGATAAGELLQDPNKALATAFQGFGGGAANVINPLQTLYSQYNSQSPSP